MAVVSQLDVWILLEIDSEVFGYFGPCLIYADRFELRNWIEDRYSGPSGFVCRGGIRYEHFSLVLYRKSDLICEILAVLFVSRIPDCLSTKGESPVASYATLAVQGATVCFCSRRCLLPRVAKLTEGQVQFDWSNAGTVVPDLQRVNALQVVRRNCYRNLFGVCIKGIPNQLNDGE